MKKRVTMQQISVGVFLDLAQFEIACAISGTCGDPLTMEVMGRSGALSHTVVVAARRWVQDTAFTHGAKAR